MKRLVILISGRGSNLQAIARACVAQRWPARIEAVLSNRPDAEGVAAARALALPVTIVDHRAHESRDAFDAALMDAIDGHRPDWVVLAGFMRILTPAFVDHYRGRLINIHPSLLPAFPGLAPHRQALQAGVRIHGATVHLVQAGDVDGGRILAQAALPVRLDDDEASLGRRVLALEHRLYPEVLRWLVQERLRIDADAGLRWTGEPIPEPWLWSE